jgi:hypothetical protein
MQDSNKPMQVSSNQMLVSNNLIQDSSHQTQVNSKGMLVNTNQGSKHKGNIHTMPKH